VLPAGAYIFSDFFSRPAISPDSQRVVYLLYGNPPASYELYSVPIHGGTPARLSLPGLTGRDISGFVISPDSSKVVFRADALTNDKYELFSVPIGGGSDPLRISSSTMQPSGSVSYPFSISSDSARVVYHADQEADSEYNLYSVPISGGTGTRLNHDLPANADVVDHQLTPDGQRVVFKVAYSGTLADQLFFTPIAESNVRRLDGGPVGGVLIQQFTVLPDSSGVVYSAFQESAGAEDVYRADFYSGPIQPAPVRLTDAPDPSLIHSSLMVTSGGDYTVFSANYASGIHDEVWRAKNYPAPSRDVARLHAPLAGVSSATTPIQITPNGQGAAFILEEVATGKLYLHSNFIASPLTPAYLLSHTPVSNDTGVDPFSAMITPNNLAVVFISDAEVSEIHRLYSNWITGGAPVSLTPNLVAGGDVQSFQIAPNSQGVVFRADGLTNDISELFLVPTGGPWTSAVRLSAPMANANGDVGFYGFSPDSRSVIYVADADTNGINELYVVEDAQLQFLPLLRR
jgi:hypothetical protein